MKKIILILFAILIIAGGLYYYVGTLKPDLIISSVAAVNKSSPRVNITVKNIGKTSVDGPVYICVLDTGSQKYLASGGKDLTCGQVALINLDTSVVGGSVRPIEINQSVTLPLTLEGYVGPLVVMVDRTNQKDTDNLVQESKEYNNSVFLYASDIGWAIQGKI